MSIKILSSGVILALLVFVVVSGCGGSKSSTPSLSSNGTSGAEGYRISSATEDNPFTTDLIAGAGQNWPGSGTDVGTVYVWNDEYYLYVAFETDDLSTDEFEGWFMQGVHLWVGTSDPTAVNPGGFPWKGNADGGNYFEFAPIPLEASYPSGNPKKPGAAYNFKDTIVNILAHAEVEFCEWVSDGEGGEWGSATSYAIYVGNPYHGRPGFEVWDPTIGGSVNVWRDEDTLFAEFTPDEGFCFCELQFYIGIEEPDQAPGQWPYAITFPEEECLEFPDSYTFEIPISELGFDLEEGVDYFVAMHVATCDGETGMGWDGGVDGGFYWDNGSWRRFTNWQWNEGETGGDWVCGDETAWGLGSNENWFRDNGFSNWGWWFEYNTGEDVE